MFIVNSINLRRVGRALWYRAKNYLADGAYPAAIFDFAAGRYVAQNTAKTFAEMCTFARASTASYVGADGFVAYAATDEARLTNDPTTGAALGLLIEESRTNLSTKSDDFADASWTKTRASIVANATTAPDGTLTADKINDDTSNNTHILTRSVAYTSGLKYTHSIFAKAGELDTIEMFFAANAFGTSQAATFTLVGAGTYAVQSGTPILSIIPYPNGWYRCVMSVTATATASSNTQIRLVKGGVDSYIGDGSGVYLWGDQLEVGGFATSYIPTNTSAVTRAADQCNAVLGAWFSASVGTFVSSHISSATTDIESDVFSMNDGTNSNTVDVIYQNTGVLLANRTLAGVPSPTSGPTYTQNGVYKTAVSYASTGVKWGVNGTLYTPLGAAAVPAITAMNIGARNGAAFLNGTIKNMAFYNAVLTDTAIQAQTT